jgi:peptidoglycan/xylan/chitin deacetylase (PgdA/CDA1 family)
MIIPAKVPFLVQKMMPKRIWQLKDQQKIAYLTFDDGPHEHITQKVLSMLSEYEAKATFFCIGDRVKKHPDVFLQIKDEGHVVGNHTYCHLNGWESEVDLYIDDVLRADQLIGSKLFRPPYGRLTRSQFQRLNQLGYQTVMWTVLSGDYDSRLSAEQCTKRVNLNLNPGSIFLFHDSEKAEKNMFIALENILEFGTMKGYTFKSLNTI